MALAQTSRAVGVRFWPEPRLLEQALGGDAVAFAEVYRRYAPRVYGFCLARLLSPDAAEDACQETFARLLSADPASVRALGPWLFGVARHVCVDIVRRGRGADPLPDEELISDQQERTAEDVAFSRADARRVLLALRRLHPRYRTALVMREVHGLPVREIAEALDITEGAAHTVLSRARDAFGKAYAEVLGLAPACARAVELIYRQTGTGIGDVERAELEAHLASCAGCRKERRRAGERVRYTGLLPLISASRAGLLARAFSRFPAEPPPLGSLGPAAAAASGASVVKTGVALLVTGSLVGLAAFSGPAVVSRLTVRHNDVTAVGASASDPQGGAGRSGADAAGAGSTVLDIGAPARGASQSVDARQERIQQRVRSGSGPAAVPGSSGSVARRTGSLRAGGGDDQPQQGPGAPHSALSGPTMRAGSIEASGATYGAGGAGGAGQQGSADGGGRAGGPAR